jgi:hypothetical protein
MGQACTCYTDDGVHVPGSNPDCPVDGWSESNGRDQVADESEVPSEVKAIARYWGGADPVIRDQGDGVWLVRSRDFEDGFLYKVTRPGEPLDLREDNGRPFTGEPRTDWVVVCVNDAPDAWWTVSAEGVYLPYGAAEVKLW